MLAYLDVGAERLHDTSTRSLTSVSGLIGLPPVRGAVFDRPEADGVVEPGNQFLGARVIVLEGETWGATVDAAWDDFGEIAQQLEAALSADVLLKWQHYQGSVELQGYVRLTGDFLPVLDESSQGPRIVYQAMVRAADPRWYSQAQQSSATGAPTTSGGMPFPIVFPIPFGLGATGGSLSLTNAGNTVTYPTVTIHGPIIGPVVTNSTQGLALYFDTLNLAAADTLVIDMNPTARTATVNGDSVLGAVRWAASKFWGINPGTETVDFYGQGGGYGAGTTMTVAWRDAYTA